MRGRECALRSVVAALLVLLPVAALAETPPPQSPRRIFSLTVFPFQLVPPVAGTVQLVELTGEARASNRVGVAFIAGAGRSRDNDTADAVVIDRFALDLGLEGRYYVLGSFDKGLLVGWELYTFDLLSGVTASRDGSGAAAELRGWATGPIAGFKYVWPIGFTVDGHVGVGRVVVTSGSTFDVHDYGVLLSLKVGWSF